MSRLPFKKLVSFNIYHLTFIIILSSCSVQKQIARSANEDVLNIKALTTAHVGISIFDPAANKYWFNYQGDKYFVPASNTKIPTCYAAMKYLGDSLVGMRYKDTLDYLVLKGTGDPTFLHTDFKNQPVFEFLKNSKKEILITDDGFGEQGRLGNGWAWNDFRENYMAERSKMPIYGNVVKFQGKLRNLKITPHAFDEFVKLIDSSCCNLEDKEFITRDWGYNFFYFFRGDTKKEYNIEMPFYTTGFMQLLLGDTLRGYKVNYLHSLSFPILMYNLSKNFSGIIHSQPTDSLLKPMMHRSDNFFAEQSLLMVSNERLGLMNDEKIIDTLLKTDFKDLPQKPRWADGSGLSRYNLFTPQDFVAILNKMKNEFGMERIKVILPTGGEGTISSYYKADSGYIYGKTGTLSGVVAFSGFLYTKKGKLLIFSTLVNNHQASATDVRRAIEKFLEGIRNKY